MRMPSGKNVPRTMPSGARSAIETTMRTASAAPSVAPKRSGRPTR